MIGKSKIDNLHILDPLALSKIWSSALKYLISLFVFKAHHDVLRFQVAMDNIKVMQMHNSIDHIANNKGTLELVQMVPFFDVLKQILAINVLSEDVFICFCLHRVDVLYYLPMVQYL